MVESVMYSSAYAKLCCVNQKKKTLKNTQGHARTSFPNTVSTLCQTRRDTCQDDDSRFDQAISQAEM